MSRLTGLLLVKTIEFSLLATLAEEYGKAESLAHLWQMFCEQSELARIGTVASLVVIVTLVLATAKMVVDYLARAYEKLKKVWESFYAKALRFRNVLPKPSLNDKVPTSSKAVEVKDVAAD